MRPYLVVAALSLLTMAIPAVGQSQPSAPPQRPIASPSQREPARGDRVKIVAPLDRLEWRPVSAENAKLRDQFIAFIQGEIEKHKAKKLELEQKINRIQRIEDARPRQSSFSSVGEMLDSVQAGALRGDPTAQLQKEKLAIGTAQDGLNRGSRSFQTAANTEIHVSETFANYKEIDAYAADSGAALDYRAYIDDIKNHLDDEGEHILHKNRLPSGALATLVPFGLEGVALDVREPDGVHNDSRAIRVRITTAGEALAKQFWVRATRIELADDHRSAAQIRVESSLMKRYEAAMALEELGQIRKAKDVYQAILYKNSETPAGYLSFQRLSRLAHAEDSAKSKKALDAAIPRRNDGPARGPEAPLVMPGSLRALDALRDNDPCEPKP